MLDLSFSWQWLLLHCNWAQFGESPTFQKNTSPLSSRSKCKQSKKRTEAGSKMSSVRLILNLQNCFFCWAIYHQEYLRVTLTNICCFVSFRSDTQGIDKWCCFNMAIFFESILAELSLPLLTVSCLTYSSTLMMEMMCIFETSGFLRTTRSYIPEDRTFHINVKIRIPAHNICNLTSTKEVLADRVVPV